jgi:hypothetical protein
MRAELVVSGAKLSMLDAYLFEISLVSQHWAPRLLFSVFNMTSQPGRPRMRMCQGDTPAIKVLVAVEYMVAVMAKKHLLSMRVAARGCWP